MKITAVNLVLVIVVATFISSSVARKDPTCKNGILQGNVCCHRSCITCGEPCHDFCSLRLPGCWFSWLESRKCCSRVILASRRRCSKTAAPCIVDSFEPPLYMKYQVQEDSVPIFGYHRIGGPPSRFSTPIRRFRNQVEYLTNVVGCNWITMERLSEYIARREKLPTKACVMTFDDAITFQYHHALCTLNEFRVPATYYLPTKFVGSHRYYLSWDEVRKLNNIGHDIEAHTQTHAHLSRLSMAEQEQEIFGCKRDLEERGYRIRTFAYPYGEYNDDTIAILRRSDYTLIRDTRKDATWKNPKTLTIKQNPDYLLHFFYIRPELEDGPELWKRAQYNGWWQFEDNYEIVRGNKRTVKLRGSGYKPTNTSYGCVKMTRRRDVISTQFLTKRPGSLTLYMVARNKTTSPAFEVKVDNIHYTLHSSNDVYYAGRSRWYGFYINIKSLSSGVHLMAIMNDSKRALYLDKFRLYSNVPQDFREHMYYKDCDPTTDDYCQCERVEHETPYVSCPEESETKCSPLKRS